MKCDAIPFQLILLFTLITTILPANAGLVQAVGDDHILNHVGPTNEVVGAGADLVREVLTRAGIQHTVTVYPWARAYSMAETLPDVLLFPLGRTAERETRFKWVGEISPVEYQLVKLKSRTDIHIDTVDDARGYQIGVQNQDIAHKFLLNKHFPIRSIQVTPGYDQAFSKLMLGRVDLVPRSQLGIRDFCEKSPANCDKIEIAYRLHEMDTSLFMAFSNKTSDITVEKARKAYREIRADGTWQKIMSPMLP